MFALRSAAAIVSAATLAAFWATPLNQPTRLARASTPTLRGVTLSSPPATCPITQPPSEPFVPQLPTLRSCQRVASGSAQRNFGRCVSKTVCGAVIGLQTPIRA
jgi:hypothetical protein